MMPIFANGSDLTPNDIRPTLEPFDPLTPTIYHETWWLAAATNTAYDELTVTESGRTVARLPYILRSTPTGQTIFGMPVLTHFLGPAIDAGVGAAPNRALKQGAILRELVSRLPRTSGFYQKMHRFIDDTLVFQEQQYDTSVQFTFEILPAPEAALWAGLRDKTRNVIRTAERRFRVEDMTDPMQFARLYEANLSRKGRANHYDHVPEVCAAALSRGRGRILAARGQGASPVAAIFYAWDARAAYYILTTRGEDAGNGAVSLLIWRAILDSVSRGLIFDFDGVAENGSRVFYTGFGGRVAPRYVVSRYSLAHRVADRVFHPFRSARSNHYQ